MSETTEAAPISTETTTDRPRDEGGRFAPAAEKAQDAAQKAPEPKAEPKAEAKAEPDTTAQDARDADAYALATGTMTQADFEAKWAGGAAPAEKDPEPAAENAEPAKEPEPAKTDEDRLAALDVLRKDYGVEFTRNELSKLPLAVLQRMAAERKPRQDKITQSFDKLKSGKTPTLPQAKGTNPESDDSPTTGATKQRTPPRDPLDEELDALSDLDPEVTAKTKTVLEAARKERDEALQKAQQATERENRAKFQAAMYRASEAHPQLKVEGVRKALLTAMEAKDPDMEVLASGDEEAIDELIESCAVRVIPPETPKPDKPARGAPDLATRSSKPRQLTQDDRDALAFEAIQKVGTDPAAVNSYIQRKLGER